MILLDTHAAVWFSLNMTRLGPAATRLVDDAWGRETLAVSAISFWELGMLAVKDRLHLGRSLVEFRRANIEEGIREVPVTGEIGISAAQLERLHGDPADRIIVATAMLLDATLITADARLLAWQGGLKAQDAAS